MQKHTPKRKDSFSSFRHDNDRKMKRKRVIIFLFFLATLLLLLRSPAEHYLSSAFHYVLYPLYVAKNSVTDGLNASSYLFQSKESLAEENGRLKDTIDALLVESYSRNALREENDHLKSVLLRNPDRPFLLARVLAVPGEVPYDTLLIDVGQNTGITPGMHVFVDGDFLIGEVTQVFARSAIVTLLSSHGNELPVRFSASGTPGVAYGMGGGNFSMVLPKTIPVNIGDIVEVPQLTPTYLGVIGAVVEDDTSSLQYVYFRLPFNVSALRYVYIPASTEEENISAL